jgi:hypothetical protein
MAVAEATRQTTPLHGGDDEEDGLAPDMAQFMAQMRGEVDEHGRPIQKMPWETGSDGADAPGGGSGVTFSNSYDDAAGTSNIGAFGIEPGTMKSVRKKLEKVWGKKNADATRMDDGGTFNLIGHLDGMPFTLYDNRHGDEVRIGGHTRGEQRVDVKRVKELLKGWLKGASSKKVDVVMSALEGHDHHEHWQGQRGQPPRAQGVAWRRAVNKLDVVWRALYSPDQPRVPAGNPDDGEFAPGDGGGGSFKTKEEAMGHAEKIVAKHKAGGGSVGNTDGGYKLPSGEHLHKSWSLDNGQHVSVKSKDGVFTVKTTGETADKDVPKRSKKSELIDYDRQGLTPAPKKNPRYQTDGGVRSRFWRGDKVTTKDGGTGTVQSVYKRNGKTYVTIGKLKSEAPGGEHLESSLTQG